MNRSLPTRALRERPDLDQLKRQAKELLDAFHAGDWAAVAEVGNHFRNADRATFALHDAQLVVARAYGFESWPKLKAYIDGVTIGRLIDAVRMGDVGVVRAMLKVRPELARMSVDNLLALHHAVLARSAEIVRILLEHGANAREGVYPHRDATSARTIAIERGYTEIAVIIEEQEQRQREARSGVSGAPSPEQLFRWIASGANEQALSLLGSTPALVQSRHPLQGWTALHVAAHALNTPLVEWLLEHGADASARAWHDYTPLDLAAQASAEERYETFAPIAAALRKHGAALTARAAVALGDTDWLRARHAEGHLQNRIEDTGGLLRIAASHNRREILELLLDWGFDPDERMRFTDGDDAAYSWGMPLYHCAQHGKYELAELLLERGADPNGEVYASGDPVFQAFAQRDWKMLALLRRYGGRPYASTAGLYRQTELARAMLAGEAAYGIEGDGTQTLAEQLLGGAACGGDPEIVRLALERVDWPRDDPRWFGVLEQPLRIWSHGNNDGWDRGTYLTCFRLVLDRCDPNLRGRPTDRGQFGLTMLHSVCGARAHVTPEERIAFAMALLNAGARLDLRDNLLKSTPLGWACRWGRTELVELFLDRGADPVERDAEPWATPLAWAQKMGHQEIAALLGKEAAQ